MESIYAEKWSDLCVKSVTLTAVCPVDGKRSSMDKGTHLKTLLQEMSLAWTKILDHVKYSQQDLSQSRVH